MSIEIKKETIGKFVVAKHCVGENGICRRDNQQFCNCNVFAGNSNMPNRYEGR